jgi:hypothetical protein
MNDGSMSDNIESPLLISTGGGFSCTWKGRQLYHPDRPIYQACNRSKAFSPLEEEIIFIPSPLLWYGVETLLEKIPSSSIILAVEAEAALYHLSRERIPEEVKRDRRVTLLPARELDSFLKRLDASRLRRCRMLTLNGAYTLHRKLYRTMFESIMATIKRFWQNRMTLTWLGPLWMKNLFANCASLGGGGNCCYAIEKIRSERPVLIVGAGPSLDEVLPLIKEYHSSFTILAVDTALASLLAHGIIPDFGLAQDGQFHTMGDFSCAPGTLEIPIFFDLTSTKSLPRHLTGGILPFFTRFDRSSFTARLEESLSFLSVLPPLGSVGITALEIALRLNAPEVWIAGLDFAYLLGKSHAKGTPYHQRELYRRSRLKPEGDFATILKRNPHRLEGKEDELPQVYTDPVLSSYHDTFSNLLLKSGETHRLIHSLRSPLSSKAELQTALEEVREHYPNSGDRQFCGVSEEALYPGKIKLFLEQELQLLERYLSGEATLIREIDYTYRFFPDLHRFDPDDPAPGFIKRIETSARRFRKQIESALTLHRF